MSQELQFTEHNNEDASLLGGGHTWDLGRAAEEQKLKERRDS